jgi:hypothetical protein
MGGGVAVISGGGRLEEQPGVARRARMPLRLFLPQRFLPFSPAWTELYMCYLLPLA